MGLNGPVVSAEANGQDQGLKHAYMHGRNSAERDIGSDVDGGNRDWHDAPEHPLPSKEDAAFKEEYHLASPPPLPSNNADDGFIQYSHHQTDLRHFQPKTQPFMSQQRQLHEYAPDYPDEGYRMLDDSSRYHLTPFHYGHEVPGLSREPQDLYLVQDRQRYGPIMPNYTSVNRSNLEQSNEITPVSLSNVSLQPLRTAGYQTTSHGNNTQALLNPINESLQYPCRSQEPYTSLGSLQDPVHGDGVGMRNYAARFPDCKTKAAEAKGSQVHASIHATQPQALDEHDCADISDDDEPLITRTLRHRSILSDAYLSGYLPTTPPADHPHRNLGNNLKLENNTSNSKDEPNVTSFETRRNEFGYHQQAANLGGPARPQSISSDDEPISFALPKYDAQFEPAKTKHDPTVAKISLPGLVREVILLSPDHAEQETHLLLNVFLPSQKSLTVPDPHPAQAVLNFHTIAVMVIEAFVQFEIGDEFGTGRGHWHQDHDHGEAEYDKIRDSKDADPDEIFFAVIDRWRAAMESNKQPSRLIRGAQEFCDVALDLVYYIKEHGLITERKRAQRSDKGVKRGDKVADKGGKRVASEAKEVTARKKPKTEKAKPEDQKDKAAKKKRPELKVTVVRKGGK